MSWRRMALLVGGAMLLPGASAALDVVGGLRTSVDYDSNVARSQGVFGDDDDFIFRITPIASIYEDDGKFQWDIDFRFPYEVAVSTDQIDGFRYFLTANGEYNLTERTRIFASDDFQKSDSLANARTFDAQGIPEVGTFRAEVYRNRATLGVNHDFTRRTSGTFQFTQRYFDSDLANRSTTNVYVGRASLNYGLDQRHRVGGGAAATYQDFSANNLGTRPPRQAFFLNLFASWGWSIDETTSLYVRAGPTYVANAQDATSPTQRALSYPVQPVRSDGSGNAVPDPQNGGIIAFDADTCARAGPSNQLVFAGCDFFIVAQNTNNPFPPDATVVDAAAFMELTDPGTNPVVPLSFMAQTAPGSERDASWTWFAEASFSKRWKPDHLTTFAYNRTDDTASGLGSSVLDSVSLIHNWQISERWRASARVDWTQRVSASPTTQTFAVVQNVPVGGGVQVAQFTRELVAQRVNQNINTQRWGTGAEVSRRITRHLRAGVRYRYNKQSSKSDTAGSLSDFDDHIVTVGVQYDFDPYSLNRYVPW